MNRSYAAIPLGAVLSIQLLSLSAKRLHVPTREAKRSPESLSIAVHTQLQPRGLPASVRQVSSAQGLHSWESALGYMWSLSSAGRENSSFWNFLTQRDAVEAACLYTAAVPPPVDFMDEVSPRSSTQDICLLIQSSSHPAKEFRWALICLTQYTPQISIGLCPTWASLQRPAFHCLLPEQSQATTQES